MNKRIEELALQAGLRFTQLMSNPMVPVVDGKETDLEKFAELIVKECIGITDELVNRNADGTWTSNELYTDYNGALFEVKRRIEQHFGVEELPGLICPKCGVNRIKEACPIKTSECGIKFVAHKESE